MEKIDDKRWKDEKNRLQEYQKNYQAKKKMYSIKMSGKTLNFDEVEINKNKFKRVLSNQSF